MMIFINLLVSANRAAQAIFIYYSKKRNKNGW